MTKDLRDFLWFTSCSHYEEQDHCSVLELSRKKTSEQIENTAVKYVIKLQSLFAKKSTSKYLQLLTCWKASISPHWTGILTKKWNLPLWRKQNEMYWWLKNEVTYQELTSGIGKREREDWDEEEEDEKRPDERTERSVEARNIADRNTKWNLVQEVNRAEEKTFWIMLLLYLKAGKKRTH